MDVFATMVHHILKTDIQNRLAELSTGFQGPHKAVPHADTPCSNSVYGMSI